MSRTKRRTSAPHLFKDYTRGEHDFTYHSGMKEYRDSQWLDYLAKRFNCSRLLLEVRTRAWFHGDKRKGKWCGRCHFERKFDRQYRHRFNHQVTQTMKLADYEDADAGLPNKSRYVHPFFYT